jgi:hypothetical protein
MTEDKRPTLSLKRKPAEQTAGQAADTPRIVRRKQVVNVTTPPAWKVKKGKLARKAEQENRSNQFRQNLKTQETRPDDSLPASAGAAGGR